MQVSLRELVIKSSVKNMYLKYYGTMEAVNNMDSKSVVIKKEMFPSDITAKLVKLELF